MEVHLLEPIMTEQPIKMFSKNFITDHEEYENFKKACLNNNKKG